MLQPRLLIRSGTAVSIITHLAVLTVGLGYAGVRPFETVPVEAIAVDLVSPAEVKEATKETPPEKPSWDIPDLSAKDQPAAAPAPAAPPPSQQQVQRQTPAASSPSPTSTARQAAAQPQPTPAPQPAPPPSPTAASWRPPEPDLSVKYQVNLGLPTQGPGNDFDAPAMSTAKVETGDIAKFRDHLKTCSILPAGIAPTDKVRIVLRAAFIPDGTLRTAPILIEASASAKGPLLMQAAIKALQQCQPYAVLPADKYNEWKVLDLSFTPQDFRRG